MVNEFHLEPKHTGGHWVVTLIAVTLILVPWNLQVCVHHQNCKRPQIRSREFFFFCEGPVSKYFTLFFLTQLLASIIQ